MTKYAIVSTTGSRFVVREYEARKDMSGVWRWYSNGAASEPMLQSELIEKGMWDGTRRGSQDRKRLTAEEVKEATKDPRAAAVHTSANPPLDTDRLEVEREAYIPLMKSLVRLKERQMRKSTPKLFPLFCVDCGEFVRDHNRNVRVRCLTCAETHRLMLKTAQDARDRLHWKRRNALRSKKTNRKNHVACAGRSALDLELIRKAEEKHGNG